VAINEYHTVEAVFPLTHGRFVISSLSVVALLLVPLVQEPLTTRGTLLAAWSLDGACARSADVQARIKSAVKIPLVAILVLNKKQNRAMN
jgi:hypothetical protein